MNNIKPIIYLIPVIALILTVILYFSLLKRATDKKAFNRFVFAITVLAFMLNFIWELIQIPFYKGSSYSIEHIAFCAFASLADAIIVLLLYFGFASIFSNPFWIKNLKWHRIVILILVGGAGATAIKLWHLSSANWAYVNSMTIIPVINVGISAVLQFMILPVLVYFLSLSYLKSMKKIIDDGNYGIK